MDGGIMTSRLLVDKIEGKSTANTVQMPSGSIVQVVSETYTKSGHATTFGSASFTDSVSITFTPKFNNSLIKHTFFAKTQLSNQDYNKAHDCRWLRDSTVVSGQSWTNYFNRVDFSADYYPVIICHFTDEPNTTNAVVYKFQGKAYGATTNGSWQCFYPNRNDGDASTFGSHGGQWTIEEIAQ